MVRDNTIWKGNFEKLTIAEKIEALRIVLLELLSEMRNNQTTDVIE